MLLDFSIRSRTEARFFKSGARAKHELYFISPCLVRAKLVPSLCPGCLKNAPLVFPILLGSLKSLSWKSGRHQKTGKTLQCRIQYLSGGKLCPTTFDLGTRRPLPTSVFLTVPIPLIPHEGAYYNYYYGTTTYLRLDNIKTCIPELPENLTTF